MSLYKQFETDISAEREGIWLEYGTNSKGLPIRIKICRAGGSNDPYLKKLEVRFKPYKRLLQIDSMDKGLLDKLIRETYAEAVLLTWEGVEDRDGNAMEFNKENALKLLTELPDLYGDILAQSQNSALFRKEVREADAKN